MYGVCHMRRRGVGVGWGWEGAYIDMFVKLRFERVLGRVICISQFG